jgi:pimeloyl-ACP methyl ester carboxylesterase
MAIEQMSSFDGVPIAFEVVGTGPDVMLLHGFASDHRGNWVQPGIRDAIVACGRRVIAYDARGHGASGKPHDAAHYENNAMVRDAQALLDHIGVTAVDVVGYSMGAIVSSRLVPVEPRTRSLVLGGIGGRLRNGRPAEARARLAAALQARVAGQPVPGGERPAERAFRRFAERSGNDLLALAAVQQATSSASPGNLGAIAVPTLVVTGVDDRLAGPPEELAARIPGAIARAVPGNHLSAVVDPALRDAITSFLQTP